MAENKVKFGLKNVHYAKKIVAGDGSISYETPVKVPGAVELSLDPRGDMIEFYADDILYYSASNNQGYEGTLTMALIPDAFKTVILGETLSADGVMLESTQDKGSDFALMFEFDGDKKAKRHVLYNVTASRPGVNGTTKNDAPEPQTDELSFVASARESDYLVKANSTPTTNETVYANWYQSVYESGGTVTPPTQPPKAMTITATTQGGTNGGSIIEPSLGNNTTDVNGTFIEFSLDPNVESANGSTGLVLRLDGSAYGEKPSLLETVGPDPFTVTDETVTYAQPADSGFVSYYLVTIANWTSANLVNIAHGLDASTPSVTRTIILDVAVV